MAEAFELQQALRERDAVFESALSQMSPQDGGLEARDVSIRRNLNG